jgi:hypothetical protein
MRRTIGLAAAVALLASVSLAGTTSAAAPASYTTTYSFSCDGFYNSTYSVVLWSKNPSTGSARQVGQLLGFCQALNGFPDTGAGWTVTARPATWAVISFSGVSGQCAASPRSYQLPTPIVSTAPCAAFPGYSVSVQIQASVRT